MRKSTLLVVSFLIAFPIVYFVREWLWLWGYGPSVGRQLGTAAFAALVLAPVIALLLTPLNRRILGWRKARGRDIEEEERYETEQGMIRLTPNPVDERDNHDLQR